MMRLHRILVLVILAAGLAYSASLGDSNSIPSMDDMNFNPFGLALDKPLYAKEPCCMPAQWEGYMGEHVEYAKGRRDDDEDGDDSDEDRRRREHGHMEIMAKLASDSDSKRVAMRMNLHQRKGASNVSITLDYNKHEMFIADYNKRTCHKVEVKEDMEKQCLPKDSKYFASVRLGSGDDSMNVDVWGAMVEQKVPMPMKMGIQILVTPDQCIPVMEGGMGISNGYFVKFGATFVNMETKISDPEIFTPPSFCKDADELSFKIAQMDPHVASLLNRFSKK